MLEPHPATLSRDILRSLKPLSYLPSSKSGAAEFSSSDPSLGPMNFLRPNLNQSIFYHSLEPPRALSVQAWRRRTSFIPSWSCRTPSVSALSCRLPSSLSPSQPGIASISPTQFTAAELPRFQPGAADFFCYSLGQLSSLHPSLEPPSSASLLSVWNCRAPSAWIRPAKIPPVPLQPIATYRRDISVRSWNR